MVIPIGEHGGGYATDAKVYADDKFTDEALHFIQSSGKQPFFLYLSFVTPHANNERTRELKNGAHVPDFGIYADEDWSEQDKGHAAMVSRLDNNVGRILEQLRKSGLDKSTLVIFTSDNGPHNESNHDLSRFNPSGPFSGIKRSLTDGGIRVPMIAWWPGRVEADQRTEHVAYFGDWMATACELSNAALPSGRDSISFVPTLLGKPQETHEFLYWEFHEGGFRQAALYNGRWKGIRSGSETAPVRLYDQSNDPAEKNDVAALHPEITNRISEYLKSARLESPNWRPQWKAP